VQPREKLGLRNLTQPSYLRKRQADGSAAFSRVYSLTKEIDAQAALPRPQQESE